MPLPPLALCWECVHLAYYILSAIGLIQISFINLIFEMSSFDLRDVHVVLISHLAYCPVNFSFFWSAKKKLTHLRDRTIFLSSLDIKEWPISKKDWTKSSRVWTKKSREGIKKLSGLWDGIIFFWSTKENEKLTRQLVAQRDWPKPHGRPFGH